MSTIEITIGPSEVAVLPERRPRRWGRCHRRIGDDEDRPVEVVLSERAFVDVHRHAASSSDEIGGILVGEAYRWRGRTYVEVEAALAGEMAEAGPAHVTFSADTWSRLLERQEREMPGKTILGWYHSHPRMGIFLSEMDLTIHRHFFSQAWHVALVVNGQDGLAGFFAWDGDEIRSVDELTWSPAARAPGGRVVWRSGASAPFSYRMEAPVAEDREALRRGAAGVAILLVAGLVAWRLLRPGRRSGRKRTRRGRRPR